jgi:hypothetical protein
MQAQCGRSILAQSAFGLFLALPEPWRSEAASVFAKLERQPVPNENCWRSFLRFP